MEVIGFLGVRGAGFLREVEGGPGGACSGHKSRCGGGCERTALLQANIINHILNRSTGGGQGNIVHWRRSVGERGEGGRCFLLRRERLQSQELLEQRALLRRRRDGS